jgi:hypothetical protein
MKLVCGLFLPHEPMFGSWSKSERYGVIGVKCAGQTR